MEKEAGGEGSPGEPSLLKGPRGSRFNWCLSDKVRPMKESTLQRLLEIVPTTAAIQTVHRT